MYEAIILAGGLGTRLRSVVNDIPKVMAPVCGKPFLHFIIQKLIREQVTRIVLSTGYKHEHIESFIQEANYPIEIVFSVEETPLGTGGGVKLALEKCLQKQVFIINGDSYFDCPLHQLSTFHQLEGADISLALKPMEHFERYGTVALSQHQIIAFREKKYCDEGLINAGVYLMDRTLLHRLSLPPVFSLEKDVFESFTSSIKMSGFIHSGYFIDIGIPEDYLKAQSDFLQM